MKVLVPTPITETTLIDSSAGALIGSSVAANSYPAWVSGAAYEKGVRYVYGGNVYESRGGRIKAGRTVTPDVDAKNWKLIGATITTSSWVGGTVYSVGFRVDYAVARRVYQCITATTISDVTRPDEDPEHWVDVGPMNNWACFDSSAGTRTAGSSPLTITIAPGVVDALATLGLVGANSVEIEMVSGADTVYSQIIDVADTQTLTSWWDYSFLPIVPREGIVLDDLPPYLDAQITITITGAGTVGVGTIAVGRVVAIGRANFGAQWGIVDYSRKETDDFGVTSLVERDYADKLDVQCWIENGLMDYVKRSLASLRATPSVYYDESGYESLIVFGYYDDMSGVIQYPQNTLVSLSLKGLA